MIWTEDLKLLTFHFCLILRLIYYQYFLKQNKIKTTQFQLNRSVLSYIKLLLVLIEFSKMGDKYHINQVFQSTN